jgi:hypothetical protein
MIGLGRILSDAREAKQVSLEQAERQTRIARRYILALEDENFDAFPARAQARGFLRLYAQYLDLDPAEILVLFPEDAGAPDDGLLRQDRIFRDRQSRAANVVPSLRGWTAGLPPANRNVLLVVAAVSLTVLVAGIISARLATHRERGFVELHLIAGEQGGRAHRVPDVRGDDLATALARMERAGITPLVIEVSTDRAPAGAIISQSPPPGTVVARGADVTIVASRGR